MTRIIELNRCPLGRGVFVECEGRELAVFHTVKGVFVLDNSCPHAGGNLSGGEVREGVVTCPWHQWMFRLCDGVCTHSDLARAASYACKVTDGVIYAELR